MEKKLYRDDMHKVIGGVCAGLGEYFSIDVSIVRLVFLLTLILKGGGMLIYIILWIVLPKKPFKLQQPFVDYTVPPSNPPQWDPHFNPVPRKRGQWNLIAGIMLVLLGAFFIIDDLNIIPDWDLEHLWPVILIAIGVGVLFSGRKTQPWEKTDWHQTGDADQTNPPTL